MTSAATATPTNEQIRKLIGAEPSGGIMTVEGYKPFPPVDYLNDPATLGEAEAYCREREWFWRVAEIGRGQYRADLDDPDGDDVLDGGAWADTAIGAIWTVIYRAAEATREQ